MPAWTNLHPVDVGDIKVGSKTPFYEDTHFEVLSGTENRTTLRCIEANPQAGYGVSSIVILDNDTRIFYDSNWQNK